MTRIAERTGTVVGRKWVIGRTLGTGGMASVYEATHRKTGFRAAVKVLTSAASPETRARFNREAYLANAIDHGGVARVVDDGTTWDGCPFLVMELLDGETLDTLRERTETGRLPVAVATAHAVAVCDVLAKAHDAGIVHRDVKPANVFVTRQGALKVLDFGIAGFAQDGTETSVTGAGWGTPMYMAPEQITGERPIDARADVYGIGAMLFRLVTGRFPFEAPTLAELALAITRSNPPRMDTLRGDVPRALADVVERALARDAEDRPRDARALGQALAAALDADDAPTSPHRPLFASTTIAMKTIPRERLPVSRERPAPRPEQMSPRPAAQPVRRARAAAPTAPSKHARAQRALAVLAAATAVLVFAVTAVITLTWPRDAAALPSTAGHVAPSR